MRVVAEQGDSQALKTCPEYARGLGPPEYAGSAATHAIVPSRPPPARPHAAPLPAAARARRHFGGLTSSPGAQGLGLAAGGARPSEPGRGPPLTAGIGLRADRSRRRIVGPRLSARDAYARSTSATGAARRGHRSAVGGAHESLLLVGIVVAATTSPSCSTASPSQSGSCTLPGARIAPWAVRCEPRRKSLGLVTGVRSCGISRSRSCPATRMIS